MSIDALTEKTNVVVDDLGLLWRVFNRDKLLPGSVSGIVLVLHL